MSATTEGIAGLSLGEFTPPPSRECRARRGPLQWLHSPECFSDSSDRLYGWAIPPLTSTPVRTILLPDGKARFPDRPTPSSRYRADPMCRRSGGQSYQGPLENLLPVIIVLSVLSLALAWCWEPAGGAINVGLFVLDLGPYWIIRGKPFPLRTLPVFSAVIVLGLLLLVCW
jgi:hypothetical protein